MNEEFNIDNFDVEDIVEPITSKPIEQKTIKSNINYPNIEFCHLHLHTFYSILDGCGSVDSYVNIGKSLNHRNIAITDHGTLSGTFEFYKKCKKAGIKPIIGMEAYVNDNIGKFEEKKQEGKSSHQIIFAMNKQGYENLNHLAYLSFTEGFYSRPRITTEQLIKYKEGLFITTSCIGGKVGKLFNEGNIQEAENYILLLKKEFGDNFALELQLNELDIQKKYNSFLINMASKHNILPILTQDVHYAHPEDNELQDVLLAINQKKNLDQAMKFKVRNCFFSSSNDFFNFNKEFGYNYPDEFIKMCLENTLIIADKCNFDFDFKTNKFPKYEPTKEVIDFFGSSDVKEIITKLAFAKLKNKLKEYQKNGIVKIDNQKTKEYIDRLNYEIQVISDKEMLDYFMVNWEIINDYRKRGYEIGPGRGSAAGCLLTWCLGITKVDPIRFGLYFERFLNPTRKCLTKNNEILLKNGDYISVDDLNLKHEPQTKTGKGILVEIVSRELDVNEDVFEVETQDGSKVELTGNHIIPVLRNGKTIDIKVCELEEDDYLITY